MSKRYEFLEDGVELLTGDDVRELMEYTDSHEPAADQVALVLGNPWATAGVLIATREQIAGTLREWLEIVEDQTPVVVDAKSEGGGQ